MRFEETLEYDILMCVAQAKRPMSLQEIHMRLQEKSVSVPLDVLKRVVGYLTQGGFLKVRLKTVNEPTYVFQQPWLACIRYVYERIVLGIGR